MDTVAIYCRTSTKTQEIEIQRSLLSRFAESNNWKYEYFCDFGYRATEDRPKFNELMLRMEIIEFRAILAQAADRLCRSPKLMNLLCTKCERLKIDLILVDNGLWLSRGDRVRIMREACFAEKEMDALSRRTKRGLENAREKGIHIGRPGRECPVPARTLLALMKVGYTNLQLSLKFDISRACVSRKLINEYGNNYKSELVVPYRIKHGLKP